MNQFILFKVEYNVWSGFSMQFIQMDTIKPNIDASLFGLYINKCSFYIDLFFISFKIFDKVRL